MFRNQGDMSGRWLWFVCCGINEARSCYKQRENDCCEQCKLKHLRGRAKLEVSKTSLLEKLQSA